MWNTDPVFLFVPVIFFVVSLVLLFKWKFYHSVQLELVHIVGMITKFELQKVSSSGSRLNPLRWAQVMKPHPTIIWLLRVC